MPEGMNKVGNENTNEISEQDQKRKKDNIRPKLFISHPHDYKQIADVLRKTISSWSAGTVQVFQSSEAYAEGPVVGGPLREEIKHELDTSAVVLVVYITMEQAGSCMFEAGIAYGANIPKRVIVFQCGELIPWAFRADLFVTVDSSDIKRFTNDFHLSENFFPGLGDALFPNISSEELSKRSTDLYQKLCDTRPPVLHTPRKIDRWISFTASLPENYVKEIRSTADEELQSHNEKINESTGILKNHDTKEVSGRSGLYKTKIKAKELIQKHCFITNYTTTAPQHFGMNDFSGEDSQLYRLYLRWNHMMRIKSSKGKDVDANLDWWSEICDQMTLSMTNWRAEEINTPVKSAHEEGTWYLPVLTKAVEVPLQQKWEFKVHFVRVPENGNYISVRENKEQ